MGGLVDPAHLEIVDPAQARAAIASAVLGVDAETDFGVLGSIALHTHQIDAVHRLRKAIGEFGGAMLCDPTGTGKTFTALALIPPGSPAVVAAPAVLRPMWTDAAQRANRSIAFVSFEALSRGAGDKTDARFLIVDEAHHIRNPSTRRFASLSRVAVGKAVLLMSATPIHNKRGDLIALLSLFLGSRAQRLSNAELGQCVLRRDNDGLTSATTPRIERLQWISIPENDFVLNMILALPPPLPPSDGGDGGVLVTHSLIRQWASSDGALRSGIVRRLQKAVALIAALEDGVYPSGSELGVWIGHDDAVQLSFSPLLARPTDRAETLLPVVRAHMDGLSGLLREIKSNDARDRERANVIRRVREEHHGSRIVVFSQFARTIETMFALLVTDGRVAALTGSGARIAGGRITRAETLQRFAPVASNHAAPRESEEITLLLTTDLLSEGVNLQDACVLIHLDLPWTPARMEQRLGRVARLGSAHQRVCAYAIRPPACAEVLVRTERILRQKMKEAGIVNSEFPSLADWEDALPSRGNTAAIEAIRSKLTQWRNGAAIGSRNGPIASAVAAPPQGFVAALKSVEGVRLIASKGNVISEDPEFILDGLQCAAGQRTIVNDATLRCAVLDLDGYLALEQSLIGIRAVAHHPSVIGSILQRIGRIAQRARPHERAVTATLAMQARRALDQNFGAAMELQLIEMNRNQAPDREWLRGVIGLVSSLRHDKTSRDTSSLIAIIILQPTNEENALSRATKR